MGVHDGHRKRVLDTFLQSGMESMHSHEILEMLLFYAIPRRDTNEIAHRLIDSFGSLRAVFDAPVEELVKIDGIGEYSAALIKMVPSLARAYLSDVRKDTIIYDGSGAAAYLLPKFVGRTRETIYLMCLDNKNKVTACVMVGEGSVNSAGVNIRRIVEIAVKYNASGIVMAHNHPDGNAMPSGDDINTTRQIMELCRSMKINFLDHIVVADNDYVSMAETGMMTGYR